MKLPKIAVSIGDPNGIGPEIALAGHEAISKWCDPVYCVDVVVIEAACRLLKRKVPENFVCLRVDTPISLNPGIVSADAGRYSHRSFLKAITLAENGNVDAVVTLPIHKEAWMQAGIDYKGHTDMLRRHFGCDAIMMLGCDKLFVALFTEHMPLRDVAPSIDAGRLTDFLVNFHREVPSDRIAVLGLNPHAGDNGVLGDEESVISKAINRANAMVDASPFFGPVVPDIAFTPAFRETCRHVVAMYHDQGLAPLKALYFDESINVSLNLPIVRTSVDHGTAFDIAYQGKAKLHSYHNAVKAAADMVRHRRR